MLLDVDERGFEGGGGDGKDGCVEGLRVGRYAWRGYEEGEGRDDDVDGGAGES